MMPHGVRREALPRRTLTIERLYAWIERSGTVSFAAALDIRKLHERRRIVPKANGIPGIGALVLNTCSRACILPRFRFGNQRSGFAMSGAISP